MIDILKQTSCDIVIASRYVKGGSIQGWPFKRKLMSKVATSIAKKGLGIEPHDPMSGFFAFKKHILEGLKFDAIGYKMLLEILVKTKVSQYKRYLIPLLIDKKVKVDLKHQLFLITANLYGNYTSMVVKYEKKKNEHPLDSFQKQQDFSQLVLLD